MKLREDGCALCGSTWGDYWTEIDGERRFFCCELCALQFGHLLASIRNELGDGRVDGVAIEGDRRGRTVAVEHPGGPSRFSFYFGGEGEVRRFRRTTPSPPPS
ncbi:MAG: TA0938 family protein [Thermoplasmata archaeon]|nr:TA0938 family protein [Thermoplasmata archaeon]